MQQLGIALYGNENSPDGARGRVLEHADTTSQANQRSMREV